MGLLYIQKYDWILYEFCEYLDESIILPCDVEYIKNLAEDFLNEKDAKRGE